ncbi:hypothetical protein [Polyangium mundeleinium]|uniref:DUF1554 domain-containing protein n=1 Tax=Polyangium mundeleinium TaxID=2995306 RepID=A0ABT5F2L6_9BACT|nr:hypothetical protein [Polyangium mundeleinium]MDC0747402.1 hypothetical protein [Polyangium mundeleinium]
MDQIIRRGWGRATLVAVALTMFGCAASGTGGSGGEGGEGGEDDGWGNGGGGAGGGGAGGSGGAGGGGPMTGPKRIFITKTTYNGNLAKAGNAATGIAGGDNLCKLAADAANLGGTWKAWLSDANTNAIDRLTEVGPWHTIDLSKVIFNNKSNIITGPLTSIGYDENGDTLGGEYGAWTGTMNDGKKDPEYVTDCVNWTNGTNTGEGWTGLGSSDNANHWTEYYLKPCQSLYHLYCFEQ